MEEKLKSVLKIPKLRLEAKAIALALGIYFLPFFMTWSILAALLYFIPSAFSFNFLGTFISFVFLLEEFSFALADHYPPADEYKFFLASVSGFLFFLLLGVKNIIFTLRAPVFFFLVSAMVFITLFGFFFEIIWLPILSLIVFLVSRDAFASFTPFPEKASLLAAVLAMLATQLSWAVFYLNISAWWSSIAIFLVFLGASYAIVNYLRGELFKSGAPFVAVACGIISLTIVILVSF